MIKARKTALAMSATVALMTSVAVAGPVVASDASPTASTVVQQTASGYITTFTAANGDQTSVYAPTKVTLTESAPVQGGTPNDPDAGGTVSPAASPAGCTATARHAARPAAVNPPCVPAPTSTEWGQGGVITPVSTSKTDAGFAGSGTPITAEQELQALGADSTTVASFAADDTATTGTFNVSTPSSKSSTTNSASPVRPASSASTPLHRPVCVSAKKDGGKIKIYGCDTTYKVGASGSTWYLEDRAQANASMKDTAVFNPDELTGFKFGVSYGSGNQITQWAPDSVSPEGKCVTNTVSLEYKGVGISSSSTECPEAFGLYGIGATHFSTKWNGKGNGPSNGSRSAHGVDSVYNGPSASATAGIYYYVWWD